MDAKALKELQAPIKARYRSEPESAQVRLTAAGSISVEDLMCSVPTKVGRAEAKLHSAAGGDGSGVCSGDMLLEALVACSGVTFAAVATAMSIPVRSARVEAEGLMDFRGTLGVDRDTPVGLTSIRLRFAIDSPAEDDELAKLVQLTERYCVVLQTLASPAALHSDWERSA